MRSLLNKTPYELLNNRKPMLSYLRDFGCKCFVLNDGKDDLGKFDPRSDEGVFVGCSSSSKANRIFNKRKPMLSYLRAFGCRCFVLNNGKDDLGKFDPRSDEGVFVRYSSSSKAYRIFNK